MTTDKLICARCDTAPPGSEPEPPLPPLPTESFEKKTNLNAEKTNCQTVDAFVPARHRPGWYRRSVPTPRSVRTPSAPRHGIAEASRTAARPELTPALGGWVGAKDNRDTMSLTKKPTQQQSTPRPSRDKALHHHPTTALELMDVTQCLYTAQGRWSHYSVHSTTPTNRAHQQRAAPPMQVNHSVVFPRKEHGAADTHVQCQGALWCLCAALRDTCAPE